jgi:hypothetical protein
MEPDLPAAVKSLAGPPGVLVFGVNHNQLYEYKHSHK